MADNPQLIVALEARLDKFEKQLKDAGAIAEREIKNIETKTSSIAIGSFIGVGAIKLVEAAMKEVVSQIEKASKELLAFEDTARKTGLDFERLQRIGFAAMTAGVSSEQMFKDMNTVAARMEEMNVKQTRLGELLDANNIKYREATGEVVKTDKALEIAADLMQRTNSVIRQNEIARMFGLTEEWVSLLAKGPEHFRQVQAEASNVNARLKEAAQHMVALHNLANRLGAIFKTWGGDITLSVLPAIEAIAGWFSRIATTLAQKAAGGPMEEMATNLANRWAIVHGEIQSAVVEAKKFSIEVNKASTLKWPQQIQEGVDWLLRFDDQLSRHILLTEAEAQAVGKTVGEREKLRALAQLEEAARRQELTLEQALTAERQKQIERAAAAAQNAAVLKQRFDELTNTSRELGSALSGAFADMVLEGKKFNDVMKDLSKTLTRMAINKAFAMIFDPTAGGGSSAFLKLLGRQAGGPVSSGSPYVVGERGPELFVPSSSGMIVPNSATRGGAGSAAVQQNVVVNDYSGHATVRQSNNEGGGVEVFIPAIEQMLAVGVARGRGALSKSVTARQRGTNLYG